MTRIALYALSIVTLGVAARTAEPCCSVLALDARTRTVTAIDRASAKLFSFTVNNPVTFKNVRLADHFDAPIARTKVGSAFAADIGKVRNPLEPCCALTTELGGAGQALGVRSHETSGVHVVLLELKRTSGNTVTAKWQYLNSSDDALAFEQKGCVGMGCTYTLAEEVHFLDGATRTKFEVLRDESNKAIAQRYEGSKLSVGAHQILNTWAKFNAPPMSSSAVTFIIPGVSEPFEDVPISQ